MPIYDLKCKSCGFIHRDVLLSTKQDPAQVKCHCGAYGMAQMPCRVHARFKEGCGGFYKPTRKVD